ncbi:GNAT family N-acetyltransferase [Runella sp. CRIBMP]|uniref:lipid II:glycine glycyltransferase FemX n=1 Tax=Runella sp. CRIBMP TaxID=2683261 RepID=UPI00141213E6|nr:GNAT family N-acetyltransferase [Runella sp. CRIBMP]NBB22966.1 GNAT family N-acetyltransferase [Runella sp. CRIBMP]
MRSSYYSLKNPEKSQLEPIEKFVKSHPNANYFQSILFFFTCRYSKSVTPVYYVAYDENYAVTGVMLAFRQAQYQIFPLNFLSARSIIWGGPLVQHNDLEVYKGLYQIYQKEQSFAIYTQVRNLSDQSAFLTVMRDSNFTYEEHLNIIVDLEKTEEQLWAEVHSKRRNEIRRAQKEGTTVELSNTPDTIAKCYLILKTVYQRAKLPLPSIDHFEALFQNSTQEEGLRIFVAKYEDKIIGCMLCLAYGTTLLDYYAGAYQENYDKYPNDLLPWEVFRWAKQNGFTRFDFGGAGKPGVPYGVREYKKKFGGEMVNYGRFEKAHFPMLYGLVIRVFNLWRVLKK